jgi:hypothetical protein
MSTARLAVVVSVLLAPMSLYAASVTNVSNTVSQNFDSLPSSGDTTFAAWSTATGQGWATNAASATIFADTGTSTGSANRFYSYGATGSTERALGIVLTNGTFAAGSTLFYGLPVTNNGTTAITSLDIAYTGEQWRANNNTNNVPNQSLLFSYGIGATGVDSGTFTNVATLEFASLQNNPAAALNGNSASFRTALSASVTGLSIAPGETVWLRWADLNNTGNDHGLAIDDFSVQANFAPVIAPIPLPAASVAGLSLLALSATRRKR